MYLKTFIQFLVLCCLQLHVNGFYFYTNGGERKCFHKELSKDTILKTYYQVQAYDMDTHRYKKANNELSLIIDVEEVFDDNHRVAHETAPSTGTYTFNAVDSGEHKICFQPHFQGWLARTKTKVEVNFEVRSGSYLDTKKEGTIQYLHQLVLSLNDKAAEIKREQDLVRERESKFRDTSERANSCAAWWAIITLIVLGTTCFWQVNHLRTFFVKQKVL
ncbi:Erp1p Ecym_6171 [Eremothecium cymbalariae DBVPG|uniref:GOLD domain-containing protein n=1 Tax=Eremothecium cymbalariae (strain CBS 270.75 / DBVPG 7215 / KCTC 17166 / NRRL Y-17582) TaxID=931890 RepID=G8JV77_ERECY|nr:hypothetical protein Ecym_6171 [Eremothecium cymbalariae DBVPG\